MLFFLAKTQRRRVFGGMFLDRINRIYRIYIATVFNTEDTEIDTEGIATFLDRINASLFSFGKMVSATLQRNRIYRIILLRKKYNKKHPQVIPLYQSLCPLC